MLKSSFFRRFSFILLMIVSSSVHASDSLYELDDKKVESTILKEFSATSGLNQDEIRKILFEVSKRLPRQSQPTLAQLFVAGNYFYAPVSEKPKTIISHEGFLKLTTALNLGMKGGAVEVIQNIIQSDPDLSGDSLSPMPGLLAAFPSRGKVPGVRYTTFPSGREAPIVDVINFPEVFTPRDPPGLVLKGIELARFFRQWRAEMPFRQKILQESLPIRNLLGGGNFYSGDATYMAKIGPVHAEALGPVFHRAVLGKIATDVTWRFIFLSRFLAETIRDRVAENPRAEEIRIIDIAGGTANTDLNAILYLKKFHPEVIRGRRVVVSLFDIDPWAATFARKSFEAYVEPGMPLSDVNLVFDYHWYNWYEPETLGKTLQEIDSENSVMVGISEGGLFEYADDSIIKEHLSVLFESTPQQFRMLGSAYTDNRVRRRDPVVNEVNHTRKVLGHSPMDWKFLYPTAIQRLSEETHWVVERDDRDFSKKSDIYVPFVLRKVEVRR